MATVPGSSFVSDPADGAHLLRFAFCKRVETLEARRGAAQPTVSDAAMSSGPGSSGFIVCGRQYRT